MIALFLAPAAFAATMLGGLVALRLKDRLHLILGFSAGALVGVAVFDLRPQARVLPCAAFGPVLAVFAGLFLYLGASDLVPESHHAHPKFLTTAMTVLGAALVYAANAVMG